MADTILEPVEVTAQYQRQAERQDWASEYNELNFVIQQKISQLQTSSPVKVVAVRPSNTFTGFVDIVPMVSQITASGVPVEHQTIFNVPYLRLQGGVNAIVIDPVIGDIGIACFASRDISAVKNSRQPSPPGSKRSYDFSDALYLGGILNSAPTRFIQFTETGIIIEANDQLTINSNVTINGNATINGTLTNNGINMTTHKHNDPQGGQVSGPV